MSTQIATEEQPDAPTGNWTRLGISDWQFCWIGVSMIWLFSPIWLRIALPGCAVLLVVWWTETSRSPSPRWTQYRDVAVSLATGNVARVTGKVFAVLTVGVVILAYGALMFLGSEKTKSEEPTLTRAFADAARNTWLYDYYGTYPQRRR